MKRRRFLTGAAAAAAGLLAPETSRNQGNIYPRLAVSYEDPGQAIALDFVGLSYESAILAGGDYFTPTNASTLGLIRSLSVNGVIRIGGNTSEYLCAGSIVIGRCVGTENYQPLLVNSAQCPLWSESDRAAALPRDVAMCHKLPLRRHGKKIRIRTHSWPGRAPSTATRCRGPWQFLG
jgi:hypothetical protein